jgi:hypothetical protein
MGDYATSVISRPTNIIAKLSTIVKIYKYRRLHERHHFISMAMEVHDALGCDMDRFIKKCVHLFHDRLLGGHLSLSFYIQFFRHHVNNVLQHVLTFAFERKIMLAKDACSRPPITIKSHHACK